MSDLSEQAPELDSSQPLKDNAPEPTDEIDVEDFPPIQEDDLPPFDQEYEDYLQEAAAAEAASLIASSSTQSYVVFYQSSAVFLGALEMLSALSEHQQKRLEQDLIDNESEDLQVRDYEHYIIIREQEYIDSAAKIVLNSQYNLTFANLYNSFESYLIDACKALLRVYPRAVKIQAETKITYAYLADHLANPQRLADVLLSQLLGESDREFSLRTVLGHLSVYLKKYNPDYLLIDERNSIDRAALIRHKIVHRYGQIDQAFLHEMASESLWESGKLPITAYPDIGKQHGGLQPGARYQVTPDELKQLSQLTGKVSRSIDLLLCVHYGKLITHDPFDFNNEFAELEQGLDALKRL